MKLSDMNLTFGTYTVCSICNDGQNSAEKILGQSWIHFLVRLYVMALQGLTSGYYTLNDLNNVPFSKSDNLSLLCSFEFPF